MNLLQKIKIGLIFTSVISLSHSYADNLTRAGGKLNKRHAYSKKGSPLPKGAKIINSKLFKKLLSEKKLSLTNPRLEKAKQLNELKSLKLNKAYVLKALRSHPKILKRLTKLPGARMDVKKLPDGNYEILIKDNRGRKTDIITLGEKSLYSGLAHSLKNFKTKTNQVSIYKSLYSQLKRAQKRKFPTLSQIEKFPPAKLQIYITKMIPFIIPTLVFKPIIPTPYGDDVGVCGIEEGSGDMQDQNSSCSFDDDGLMKKTLFPLRNHLTCVKNQASRGTCVSFAVTAGIETAYSVKTGRKLNLSEQRLYYKGKKVFTSSSNFGDGLNTSFISTAVKNDRMALEKRWDYNPSTSRDSIANMLYINSCNGYNDEHCSDTNHQGDLVCTQIGPFNFCGYDGSVAAVTSAKVGTTASLFLAFNPTLSLELMKIYLNAKFPVTMSIPVTPTFDNASSNGIMNYVGSNEDNRGGHAVLVVGYIANENLPSGISNASGGGYFIIKNSWGRCWKDGGYVYIPYNWVKSYARSLTAMKY